MNTTNINAEANEVGALDEKKLLPTDEQVDIINKTGKCPICDSKLWGCNHFRNYLISRVPKSVIAGAIARQNSKANSDQVVNQATVDESVLIPTQVRELNTKVRVKKGFCSYCSKPGHRKAMCPEKLLKG
ncbi:hypothetical protein B5S32_g5466 [[Candida] boidinii]|nr:hypothetical protein B5S32_g5466 [[Candida] boidinii]